MVEGRGGLGKSELGVSLEFKAAPPVMEVGASFCPGVSAGVLRDVAWLGGRRLRPCATFSARQPIVVRPDFAMRAIFEFSTSIRYLVDTSTRYLLA